MWSLSTFLEQGLWLGLGKNKAEKKFRVSFWKLQNAKLRNFDLNSKPINDLQNEMAYWKKKNFLMRVICETNIKSEKLEKVIKLLH